MSKKREVEAETPHRDRVRIATIAIFGGLAAFGVFGGFSAIGKSAGNASRDPYEAIPKASFIAATVDFAELRRSPLYDVVFGKGASGAEASLRARRALGVDGLADACGFDPMTRVQKIAVSVPEEGDRGEFGVAARVEVTRDELERCTQSLAEKRGGRAETRDVGSFVVLEDKSVGGASSPRLGYGKGGLLIVGKGTWFDAMLGAADRAMPGLRDAQEHVSLRTSMTSREGFRTPTVLVTAILPRSLRDRLKGEMGAETGAPASARGGDTAARDLSNAAMAGVLGVSAVGIAVRAGGPGSNVEASVDLVCDSVAACAAVDKLLKKKRAEWSGDLALRMVGLGSLLDSIEVKLEGSRLRATASAQSDALAATIDRVMRLRTRREAAPIPAPQTTAQRPADETILAHPDAGGASGR